MSSDSVRQSSLFIKKPSVANDNSKNETDSDAKKSHANKTAFDIAEKMLNNCDFSSHLGIELVDAKVNYSVCKMVVKPVHTNGHDTCHGGAIFSLADTTFAHLCNASNQITVGHICTIAYWKPAHIGDELYAYAYESGVYGRSGSYRVEITRGKQGEIVAEFQGFSRSLKGQSHFTRF